MYAGSFLTVPRGPGHDAAGGQAQGTSLRSTTVWLLCQKRTVSQPLVYEKSEDCQSQPERALLCDWPSIPRDLGSPRERTV